MVMVVLVVVMLAQMMSSRVVGTVLCHCGSGATERYGQRYGEDCADAGNKLHLCLLTHECCTRFASSGHLVFEEVRTVLPSGSIQAFEGRRRPLAAR